MRVRPLRLHPFVCSLSCASLRAHKCRCPPTVGARSLEPRMRVQLPSPIPWRVVMFRSPCRPAARTSVFQAAERGCNSRHGCQAIALRDPDRSGHLSGARTHRSSCRAHRRGSYPRTRGFDSLSCDDRSATICPLVGPPQDGYQLAPRGEGRSDARSSNRRSMNRCGEVRLLGLVLALLFAVLPVKRRSRALSRLSIRSYARTNAGFNSLHCDRRS